MVDKTRRAAHLLPRHVIVMDHPTARRVPALVVSGFLGSGKTTTVLWLLEDARRRSLRAAVVSNEFGALGIDKALLGDGAEAIVELEGGCVCCQLSNDLKDSIIRLRREVDPDIFIVETSGLALASETLLSFWRDPVRDWISDELGLVVVNAEQVVEGRDLEGTFEDQLSAADVIVLNKVDLVAPENLVAIEATLRRIEPEAPIVRVSHGRIDPAVLVPDIAPDVRHQRLAGKAADPGPHQHDNFRSEILSMPPGTTRADITAQLRSTGSIRAKGFVTTEHGVELVQLVGSRISFAPSPVTDPSQLGKVVVVRRLRRDVAPPGSVH